MKTLILFFIVLSLLPTAQAGTAFVVESGTSSCSGGFSLSSFDVSCSDDSADGEACKFGGSIGVDGTVVATSDFPEEATVAVQVCVASWFCHTLVTKNGMDLCSTLDLQSSDGATYCPSSGTYTFSTTVPLPGNENWGFSWLNGHSVGLKTLISETATNDNDSNSGDSSSSSSTTWTECSFQISTVGTDSSSSSNYQMITGSIVIVLMLGGGGVAFIRRRRRRLIQESDRRTNLLRDEFNCELPNRGVFI